MAVPKKVADGISSMLLRLALASLFIFIALAGCGTSDVSWNQEQIQKSISLKQSIYSISLPVERQSVLKRLGSPVLRYEERASFSMFGGEMLDEMTDDALAAIDLRPDAPVDPIRSALRSYLDRQNFAVETFGYLTGSNEVTRIFVLSGYAVVTDSLFMPEALYGEQGPWVSAPADSIRTSEGSYSSYALGNVLMESGDPNHPGGFTRVFANEAQMTIVSNEPSGLVYRVSSVRFADLDTASRRGDVLMSSLAAFMGAPINEMLARFNDPEVLRKTFEGVGLETSGSESGVVAFLKAFGGSEAANKLEEALFALREANYQYGIGLLKGQPLNLQTAGALQKRGESERTGSLPWTELRVGVTKAAVESAFGVPDKKRPFSSALTVDSASGHFIATELWYYASSVVGFDADGKVTGWRE